jgi:heme exporter protein C
MPLIDLANPHRFQRLAAVLIPLFGVIAAVLIAAGLVMGFRAPADYQQGEMVKVMYIHVPFAWLSLMAYTLMAIAALGTIVWRHPLADVAGKAAAQIGAAFCFLCLVTGSLWGRPTWGTYWDWDPRLTSVLVLFLLYLGVLALWRAFDDPNRAGRAAAILALVGFINVPIVKFSVDWWNTLHQPESVFRMDGPTIDPSMLRPLLLMALASQLYFFLIACMRMKAMLLEARRRNLAYRRAAAPATAGNALAQPAVGSRSR